MPDQVDAMIAEATRRAADLRPVEMMLGRVLYHPRAVMLEVGPAAALKPVLDMVGYATRAATEHDGELHTAPWVPHITLAYSNAAQPVGLVISALGRQLPGRKAAITSVSLVSQTPQQKWTWK